MDILIQKLTENLLAIIILFALCYGLSQSRRVTNDVMNHLDKIGENEEAKKLIVHKLLFNFYFIFIAIIIIAAFILNLINTWTSIISLIIDFIVLVVKLVNDIWHKSN